MIQGPHYHPVEKDTSTPPNGPYDAGEILEIVRAIKSGNQIILEQCQHVRVERIDDTGDLLVIMYNVENHTTGENKYGSSPNTSVILVAGQCSVHIVFQGPRFPLAESHRLPPEQQRIDHVTQIQYSRNRIQYNR